VLSGLPVPIDDRVLVDFRTADDAGVYRWESGPALVQTVDFFTPIVDDPYVYGQIAAANAVSDVYAMGGQPLTALAIAGFPLKDGPDPETIRAIFRGGLDKLREAGVSLLGGHTVQDPEIKFGYAITGAVDPARVLTNAGARPGDTLLLTKALGTGVIATALKFGRAPERSVNAAIASMTTLNRAAGEAMRAMPSDAVHACTDITGFGLMGHAVEMGAASGCRLEFELAAIPFLEGAEELAQKNLPGGGRSNREHFETAVRARTDEPDRLTLLYDAQTSGGLLIAVDSRMAAALLEKLRESGTPAARVGRVVHGPGPVVSVN
jgi:selenide,water dikinase